MHGGTPIMPRRLPLARPLGVLILPVAIAAGIASAQATPALQNTPLQPAPAAVQLAQAMGTPAEAYSEQQLQAYAAAVMKVQEIDRAWQPKIGQAQSQEEAERSEEHTSELQSLMRISYAVFCLKKKKIKNEESKQ